MRQHPREEVLALQPAAKQRAVLLALLCAFPSWVLPAAPFLGGRAMELGNNLCCALGPLLLCSGAEMGTAPGTDLLGWISPFVQAVFLYETFLPFPAPDFCPLLFLLCFRYCFKSNERSFVAVEQLFFFSFPNWRPLVCLQL